MNLTLDIGSSRSKAGLFEGGRLMDKAAWDGIVTAGALEAFIGGRPVAGVAVADVGGRREAGGGRREAVGSGQIGDNDKLFEYLHRFPCLILDHTIALPITIKYETPETLGPDRLAAAVGANHLFRDTNVLAIDAGTCITCEFVSEKNEYLGGSISPGPELRFRSMNDYTARLPLVTGAGHAPLTGRNTEEAIRSGVQNGIVAEIQGIIDAYRAQFPGLRVVLAGGAAGLFDGKLKNDIFAAPDLVLLGLNVILEFNKKDQVLK